MPSQQRMGGQTMAITLRQMDEKPLEKFFDWIENNNLALPELQRPKCGRIVKSLVYFLPYITIIRLAFS